LASFSDLRLMDTRPVETGRGRIQVGPVFAGAVRASFAALQFQVELASQPEQQGTSIVGSPTTSPRELQTAAAPAGNPRQGVGRV
jgi:hypothetical protein